MGYKIITRILLCQMWKTQYITSIPEASYQTLASIHTPLIKYQGAVLWLHETNQELKKHADLLKIWQKIFHLPKNILTWPDQEQPELSVLQALYQNHNSIICTTQENLELSVASWQFLQDNSLNLNFGEKIDLYQLMQDLHAMGLERAEEVWNENTFSIRGSLVSIYQNNTIYRFNVWADKIEEIIKIDPYLKQTPEKINSFIIWPNQITHKEKISLHLPNTVLLGADITFEPELQNFNNTKIIFDPFKNKADFNFVTENILWQHKNTEEKIKYLTTKLDYQIIWFTKNQALAKDFLKDSKLKPSFVDLEKSAAWPSSFCAYAEKIILVNDNLFFQNNEHEIKNKQRQKFTLDFILGDLVVHRDHGIARLEKITTLEVENIKREYFVLKYAQNDTLFVPLDLADKLEKYVGPANPKINRLSKDNLWPQTLRKIKQETFILANQLLNIEATRKLHSTPIIQGAKLLQKISEEFPYTETISQQQAIDDVLADLKSAAPADRLICGDVGFGKTEVALRASVATVESGYQVALLCPTTILAQQHYDLFSKRLSKHGVNIALLSRWQDEKQSKENIQKIKTGEIDIIIGTHRILSKDIFIPKLQLLIIDEEQNFGVEDKEKLKKHKSHINVLTLSATPIPRTLNMALSLIKDISLITDPIANRHDIKTEVKMISDEIILEAINQELKNKGQVYFLHNRVETISLAYKKIQKLFPKNKIAVAHGQMDDKSLANTMHAFDTGEIDILVCSTIIANGLDIPNANTLIVTEAENFGLSQLHQLRGRIGRSDKQAYAYFLYSQQKLSSLSQQRLAQLKLASGLGDGFKIANKDLELRGVGQILGKAQSGKVKSIGLGLYQELIAETVAELKGQTIQIWRDIDIKLKLQTELPKNFFNSAEEKLFFFQKISRIKDLETLAENSQHISNEEHQNILYLQKLKILAQKTDIISIQEYQQNQKEFVSLNFLNPLDYKKLALLQTKNPNWRSSEQQIKINKEFLSTNFKQDLEKLILLWSNNN